VHPTPATRAPRASQNTGKSGVDDIMKQPNPACELPVSSFLRPLSVTARYDDFSQALNVIRKKYRIVEQ
jgi:hypothetical protein